MRPRLRHMSAAWWTGSLLLVEAVITTYKRERAPGERFIDTARRLGVPPFRAAADAVRRSTARAA